MYVEILDALLCPGCYSSSETCFVFQYLLKVNEIKTKKGVDLVQNLIKYFHAQCKCVAYIFSRSKQLSSLVALLQLVETNQQSHTCFMSSFFQDGLKVVENFKPAMEKLSTDLTVVSYLYHLVPSTIFAFCAV